MKSAVENSLIFLEERMDIRKIKKLIELVEESGITELEVQEEEGTVRISRAAPAAAPQLRFNMQQRLSHQGGPAAAPVAAALAEAPAAEISGHQVRSPMVGTFYRSPSPSESFRRSGTNSQSRRCTLCR